MDIILDPSLVLYLPLYELDGGSFISRDAFGHLCTATGALWRPDGHYFDGSDDLLTAPDHPALTDIFDGGGAVCCWMNPASAGEASNAHFFEKGLGSAAGASLMVRELIGGLLKVRLVYYFTSALGVFPTVSAVVPVNSWSYVSIVYNSDSPGNQPAIYVNDTSVPVGTGTPAGTRKSDAGNDVHLGNTGATDKTFNGLLGEYHIYRRELTSLEIQKNYLATKWRYQ